MLIWRVFLDGDPFKTLGEFQGKYKEKRQKRNDAIALLKDQDHLVQHVCCSLALSEKFSRTQLEILCEIIGVTLIQDSARRELDMTRLIRLLTPDEWFQPRHPILPERIPLDVDAQLLDMEKWHSEFANRSPLVQGLIASGFKDYAEGFSDQLSVASKGKRIAAAYQLAICYANGFGVTFEPDECLRWLTLAADGGSQKAHEALPKLLQAFKADPKASLESELGVDDASSMLSSSWASDLSEEDALVHIAGEHNPNSDKPTHETLDAYYVSTLLNAAENCNYDVLDKLLSDSAKPTMSEDGVSVLSPKISHWSLLLFEFTLGAIGPICSQTCLIIESSCFMLTRRCVGVSDPLSVLLGCWKSAQPRASVSQSWSRLECCSKTRDHNWGHSAYVGCVGGSFGTCKDPHRAWR